MPYFYGFDWTYLVLVVPALLLAFWAQRNVKNTFQRYDAVKSERGITGAGVARLILDYNGLQQVQVVPYPGSLTDHYDPRSNVVRLSESTYYSSSVSAIGVAAHEVGHAIQYARGYSPIRLRSALVPVCQLASNLAMPLFLMSIIFSFYPLAYIGIIAFGLATLFQVVTLPVEFDASSRAMASLQGGGILYGEELEGARKTLKAAALTYVAALFVSLMNLLRLLLLFGGRGGRR